MSNAKEQNKKLIIIYKIISAAVFVIVMLLSLFYGIKYAAPTSTAEAYPTYNTITATPSITHSLSNTPTGSPAKTAKPTVIKTPKPSNSPTDKPTSTPSASITEELTPSVEYPSPTFPPEQSPEEIQIPTTPDIPLSDDLSVTIFPCVGSPIIILHKGHAILINTGYSSDESSALSIFLREHNIDKIDALIITQPSSNNIGGVTAIMNHFTVGKVFCPTIPNEYLTPTKDLAMAQNAMLSAGEIINISMQDSGYPFSFSDYKIELFVPQFITDPYEYSSYSLAVYLEAGGSSFLLSSNFPKDCQYQLDTPVDVLVLPNYGVNGSLSQDLLINSNPTYAIFQKFYENITTDETEELLSHYNIKPLFINNKYIQFIVKNTGYMEVLA